MFDGTIMKIMSSKKLVQMIVGYFVANTFALVEWYWFYHPRTWCCPMPQKFVAK